YAHPGVGDGQRGLTVGRRVDGDLPAGAGELDRVDHEVVEGLGEALGIAPGRYRAAAAVAQLDLSVLGERPAPGRHLVREVGQVELGDVELHSLLGEAGDQQQLVDQAQQPVRVA